MILKLKNIEPEAFKCKIFGGSVYSFFIACSSSYSTLPLMMTMFATVVISLLCVFSTDDTDARRDTNEFIKGNF